MQVRFREGLFAKLERQEREIGAGHPEENAGDESTAYSLDGVEHGILSDTDETKESQKKKKSNGRIFKFSKLKKNSSLSALSTVLTPRLSDSTKVLELNEESDEENGL